MIVYNIPVQINVGHWDLLLASDVRGEFIFLYESLGEDRELEGLSIQSC